MRLPALVAAPASSYDAVRALIMACAPESSSMRAKDLKAELDERGVSWRGVAFEKDELCRLLEEARLAPPPSAAPPPPPSAAPSPPPPASAPPSRPQAAAGVDAERAEVARMKVSAIKAELKELGVDASTMFEKPDFVVALLKARSVKRAEPAPKGTSGQPSTRRSVGDGRREPHTRAQHTRAGAQLEAPSNCCCCCTVSDACPHTGAANGPPTARSPNPQARAQTHSVKRVSCKVSYCLALVIGNANYLPTSQGSVPLANLEGPKQDAKDMASL